MITGARRLSDKIVTNTVYNVAGRLWQIFVSFFLTPYIIYHIGVELFGVWALIGVLIGYLGLLDFGVSTSFVKYISEYYTLRKYNRINDTVKAGLFLYLIIAPVIIVSGVFFVHPLFTLLQIPVEHYQEASQVFWLGLAAFLLKNIFSVFSAVLSGLQRLDVLNKVYIIATIPRVLGTLFVLEKGFGIVGLMCNELIVLLCTSCLNIFFAYRVFPNLRIWSRRKSSRITIKRLLSFGIRIHTSNIALMINLHFDKILIGAILNTVFVGFYEIAARLTFMARSLPSLIVSAVMPAVSELYAKNENEKIYQLFVLATKSSILIATPIMFFLFQAASQVIFIWMGGGYTEAVPVVQMLAVAYYAVIPTGAISHTVQGINKPNYQMKASLFILFINVLFSTALTLYYGFLGAPMGTMIACILSLCYYTNIIQKHFNRSFIDFARRIYVKPVLICIALNYLFEIAEKVLPFMSVSGDRIVVLGSLLIKALIFFSLYIVLIVPMGYLDHFEKGHFRLQLESLFPKLRRA